MIQEDSIGGQNVTYGREYKFTEDTADET